MSIEPILGTMNMFERDGEIVAVFQRLANPDNPLQSNKAEYTHAALFGIGRNPINTMFMHADDQQKIADAKNVMIEVANLDRAESDYNRQMELISKLGVLGFVSPRKPKLYSLTQ